MRQEPPKSCPRAVQEATHKRLGAKTRHKAAPDSLQTSILDPPDLDFGPSRPRFLTLYFRFGAVAGTQLCCVLDPPRQAYGLRMAYGVNLL